MPAAKCDFNVTVTVRGESFSIGGLLLPGGKRCAVKRGRSWSKKTPIATVTEIYAVSRKWTVRRLKSMPSMPRVGARVD